MSTKVTIVAAIAALALCVGAAQANTKGPSKSTSTNTTTTSTIPHAGGAPSRAPKQSGYAYYQRHHGYEKCYWLPTMSNGNLSGLEQKCIWIKG